MADPEGPGRHRPRECYTRNTLDTLGDTRKFGEPGVLHQVYGFKLENGFYERAPLVAAPAVEEPDWDVKLVLRPQYLDLEDRPATETSGSIVHEGEHVVKRLVNSGKMFVVYVTNAKEHLELSGELHFYTITTKNKKDVCNLKALPVTAKDKETLKKPPSGSTAFLELVLGAHPPDAYVEVLPNLRIKWRAPAKLVGFLILFTDGVVDVKATNPDVTVDKIVKSVSLQFIECSPYFGFVRLLFSTLPVSTAYIERLIADSGRLEALLKTRIGQVGLHS